MYKISAHQIAEKIETRSIPLKATARLIYSDERELFFQDGPESYISVFNYGVVAFFNCEEKNVHEFFGLVVEHCDCFFYDDEITKEYHIETHIEETKFGFKRTDIVFVDSENIRLFLQNIARSVALDNYSQHARLLLKRTNEHVSSLERKGRISISNQKLKRFIGESHHLKNKIVADLRLLDSDSEVSQDDYLIAVDSGIKDALFIEKRANNIYEELNMINEHLESFREIVINGSNLKIAWVEIILLATFVIDIIVKNCF
jgi:required for meiotic nuclear division protein 1